MARSKKEIGTGFITQMDRYLFGEGTHYQIYDKLGAHPMTINGVKGTRTRKIIRGKTVFILLYGRLTLLLFL